LLFIFILFYVFVADTNVRMTLVKTTQGYRNACTQRFTGLELVGTRGRTEGTRGYKAPGAE